MANEPHVLVVDDEEGLRYSLSVLLKKKGYRVSAVENGQMALQALDSMNPDFILCDLRMPVMDGLTFLQESKRRNFEKPIIVMSAYGTIDQAVEAMRLGAYDYIGKPFNSDEILVVLHRAAERELLRAENLRLRQAAQAAADREIITDDSAMLELMAMARKVAGFKSTVLIVGESGTGKELIARSIHRNSPRADKPFVAINCGAIPEHLLESELFGHKKGSFTDAIADKEGLVTGSSGGTLFLDEIGELPLMLQVKLLRVLQEERVRPIGAAQEIPVDLRVVAATARNLEEVVEAGQFREDLYYRLNVFTLKVPPLRQRAADLPLLTKHFIQKVAERHGLPMCEVSAEALKMIEAYHWPGNVRELENVMERAVVLSAGDVIEASSLPDRVRQTPPRKMPYENGDLSVKHNLRDLERELIVEALKRTKGNKSRAARHLDLSLRALIYKIRDYNLETDKDESEEAPEE
ncbi:MAG TPA: sigma-54 dependent transcriptional regulator [bacterium]|nr:sigma-54 dependent transcriptional regulator [bacterium]